jgi:hypothetical protein
METLGTFTLNMKNRYLIFYHNRKEIILYDLTVKFCIKTSSSRGTDDMYQMWLPNMIRNLNRIDKIKGKTCKTEKDKKFLVKKFEMTPY